MSEHALLDTPSAICAFYDDVKGQQATNVPSLAVACGKPATCRRHSLPWRQHPLTRTSSCPLHSVSSSLPLHSSVPLSISPIFSLTPDLSSPHYPVAGHVIFVYKRLRPYYKFALPMQQVDPAEADVSLEPTILPGTPHPNSDRISMMSTFDACSRNSDDHRMCFRSDRHCKTIRPDESSATINAYQLPLGTVFRSGVACATGLFRSVMAGID